MKASRLAVLAFVSCLAACSTWRWSGSAGSDGRRADAALHGVAADESRHPAPPADFAREDAASVSVSTHVVRPPTPAVPPTPEGRAASALYYSDMGPDTIDVSAYPAQQQYNYKVFARACSRCHTLARSVNAPLVGRGWWEFYMLGMRMRSRREGQPLPKDEVTAILDFLEYDSRVRKVEHAREFDALTAELRKRFDESVARRLQRMQKKSPRLLDEPGR